MYAHEKLQDPREKLSFDKLASLESKELGRNLINQFSESHYDHVIKRENNENEKDFSWGNESII